MPEVDPATYYLTIFNSQKGSGFAPICAHLYDTYIIIRISYTIDYNSITHSMPICSSLLQLSAPPDKSEKLPTKAVGAIHTTEREIRKRHGRVMEARLKRRI